MEYLIRNRLSWLCFLKFDLDAPTPDANTSRLFREKLTEAARLQVLFDALNHRLRTNGYLAMGGKVVDTTLVAARKQRNADTEKAAIPSFGYKNHIAIDREHGIIRNVKAIHGARHNGAMLRDVVTRENTGSDDWADTAYRQKKNDAWLRCNGRTSQFDCRMPISKPMPERTSKANGQKSKGRALIVHVFAHEKYHMGLFIRTIGIKRAAAG